MVRVRGTLTQSVRFRYGGDRAWNVPVSVHCAALEPKKVKPPPIANPAKHVYVWMEPAFVGPDGLRSARGSGTVAALVQMI
jgi:hypothetical protein